MSATTPPSSPGRLRRLASRLHGGAHRAGHRLLHLPVLADVPLPERLLLWATFFVAMVLIAVETVSFQALVYVNEYLPATQVIAVALTGIALGGLLAFFVPGDRRDRALGALAVAFPVLVLATYFVIARLNPWPFVLLPLLTLPYVVASLFVSLMFNAVRPSLVYLFDLCGAGLGALVAVLLIPVVREEGTFILLTLLGTAPLALLGLATPGTRRGAVAAAMAGGALVLLGLHVTFDPFNLAFIGTADREQYGDKIFFDVNPRDANPEPTCELMYSRGSLVERIDIGFNRRAAKKNPKSHDLLTWFNGRANDHVNRGRPKVGDLDRRLPTRLKLGQDPDTLLVGPAAEGLTKPVRALGNGHVDAVEINGAIMRLMLLQLYRISGRAYEGFDLTLGDVRTFLARSDRRYDYITLLNTHRIRTIGQQGPPEYCHSLEAMRAYLAHLKDDGFVVFEERNVNERADLGIRRMLRTMRQALLEQGAERPEDHFAIYEFFVCPKATWMADREKCNRGSRYTMVMVKRSPITQAEHDSLLQWEQELGDRKPDGDGNWRGIEWMYLPQKPLPNYWTETLTAPDVYATTGVDASLHNMETVTDDRPFPYDVFLDRPQQRTMVRDIALLAGVMVLLPTLAAFAARRRETDGSATGLVRAFTLLVLVPFFAILGLGYLLVEIVLMQWFQIFLSSPVWSIVVVLGGLLVSSGIGGYVSGRVRKLGALGALLTVTALAGLYASGALHAVLGALLFLPFPLRILVALLLIAPLGFAMGMPFPWAMAVAKDRLSARHAGLFFGINGAVGAVASPLAIWLSMTRGFGDAFALGALAYAACLVLLAVLPTGGRRG